MGRFMGILTDTNIEWQHGDMVIRFESGRYFIHIYNEYKKVFEEAEGVNFHTYNLIERMDTSKAIVGDIYYDMARCRFWLWTITGWVELFLGVEINHEEVREEIDKVLEESVEASEEIEFENWEDMSWEELIEKWEEKGG